MTNDYVEEYSEKSEYSLITGNFGGIEMDKIILIIVKTYAESTYPH